MADESLIAKIFPRLEESQLHQLVEYSKLLGEWNEKINLVSRKDIQNVIGHHIIPSLSISTVGNFTKGEDVLDIGTGGGLPGIPLAIVCRETSFTLMDSVGKKIMAVNDMLRRLNLQNVKTVNIRAEDFFDKFDKIVGRAVTNLADFLKYSKKLLKPKGKIFYLKGGDYGNDLGLPNGWNSHNVAEITGIVAEITGIRELEDKVILEIF
ncbi:MAG: 16S rRNA (guanine(527)-N(7))-methyltransferase RsmG [Puniceicoccales bacterium]|jgi:16S rRNA (guanine527-N7)-methyltransferase|nr:16S rRNA (guanine(527)-N(7))-methyltransferase RsmG [Puniceicoccales bacterium]